jgi:hypothetical protein
LEFSGPEQVELRCYLYRDETCEPESYLTVTGSTMAYQNSASKDHIAVVDRESVDVKFPSRLITLYWNWFSDIGQESRNQRVASPFVVHGEYVTSHETQFLPRAVSADTEQKQRENFYYWKDFLNDLKWI